MHLWGLVYGITVFSSSNLISSRLIFISWLSRFSSSTIEWNNSRPLSRISIAIFFVYDRSLPHTLLSQFTIFSQLYLTVREEWKRDNFPTAAYMTYIRTKICYSLKRVWLECFLFCFLFIFLVNGSIVSQIFEQNQTRRDKLLFSFWRQTNLVRLLKRKKKKWLLVSQTCYVQLRPRAIFRSRYSTVIYSTFHFNV